MALFSPLFSPPLLASRKPPSTPPLFLLKDVVPQAQSPKVPTVSHCSPGARHLSTPQPLRNSTSSDPSFTNENPTSSRIFIKGLHSASEGYLVKLFSRFGDINRAKIITSKTSKEPLGLAYIWFACEEDAHLAVKQMDGKFVDGRFIAVMIARPETPTKQVRAIPYKF